VKKNEAAQPRPDALNCVKHIQNVNQLNFHEKKLSFVPIPRIFFLISALQKNGKIHRIGGKVFQGWWSLMQSSASKLWTNYIHRFVEAKDEGGRMGFKKGKNCIM
jgi:hypothetical protein